MDRRDSVAVRIVAGILGGLAAGAVMNAFGTLVRSIGRGREAPGAAPGADRAGRGAQPPQAAGPAEDDAAVRAGSALYEHVAGRIPPARTRMQLGQLAHYGFSAGAGLAYTLTAPAVPALRAGRGLAYGTVVWVIADEIITPALRLSKGPRQLSLGVLAYALAAHWVYGVSLDAATRMLGGASTSKAR
jgi:hypothetical protein